VRMCAAGEEDAFGDDYPLYAARSRVLRWGITFGSVAPLALLGLGLTITRRTALGWCSGIALAYAGSLLFFFVTARYRLPIVPPLLLCAALGLAWLADLWVASRLRAVVVAVGLVLTGHFALGAAGADLARLVIVVLVGTSLAARVGQNPT